MRQFSFSMTNLSYAAVFDHFQLMMLVVLVILLAEKNCLYALPLLTNQDPEHHKIKA